MINVIDFRKKDVSTLKIELKETYKNYQEKCIMFKLKKDFKLKDLKDLKYKIALINTLLKEKELLNG